MTKNAKILISITVLALLAVAYIIIQTEPVYLPATQDVKSDKQTSTTKETASLQKQINQKDLEEKYTSKVKDLVTSFEQEIAVLDATSTATTTLNAMTNNMVDKEKLSEKIAALKIELLEQSVPKIYKDLHLDLVLAFTKMINYLHSGEQSAKEESLAQISKDKELYPWLNGKVLGENDRK